MAQYCDRRWALMVDITCLANIKKEHSYIIHPSGRKRRVDTHSLEDLVHLKDTGIVSQWMTTGDTSESSVLLCVKQGSL